MCIWKWLALLCCAAQFLFNLIGKTIVVIKRVLRNQLAVSLSKMQLNSALTHVKEITNFISYRWISVIANKKEFRGGCASKADFCYSRTWYSGVYLR